MMMEEEEVRENKRKERERIKKIERDANLNEDQVNDNKNVLKIMSFAYLHTMHLLSNSAYYEKHCSL